MIKRNLVKKICFYSLHSTHFKKICSQIYFFLSFLLKKRFNIRLFVVVGIFVIGLIPFYFYPTLVVDFFYRRPAMAYKG